MHQHLPWKVSESMWSWVVRVSERSWAQSASDQVQSYSYGHPPQSPLCHRLTRYTILPPLTNKHRKIVKNSPLLFVLNVLIKSQHFAYTCIRVLCIATLSISPQCV